MPEGLTSQLASLRTKYFTGNALRQFEEAEKEYWQDGEPGYDLLILGFDFDKLWRPSIKIAPIKGDTYQVCFDKSRALDIKLAKQGEEYRIDGIKRHR